MLAWKRSIMFKLHAFSHERLADHWLMIKTFLTLTTVNLLLKLVSVNRLQKLMAAQPEKYRYNSGDLPVIHRTVKAIEIADRNASEKFSCMAKALSGYYLLATQNIPVEMCVGVKLGLPGQLDAHAWILYQGEVVLGRLDDISAYTKLTEPTGKAS